MYIELNVSYNAYKEESILNVWYNPQYNPPDERSGRFFFHIRKRVICLVYDI